MSENISNLLKQIALDEDSVLELKLLEFSGAKSISERRSARNELISSLLARCPMNVDAIGSRRNFIMDKRGEGVPIFPILHRDSVTGRGFVSYSI